MEVPVPAEDEERVVLVDELRDGAHMIAMKFLVVDVAEGQASAVAEPKQECVSATRYDDNVLVCRRCEDLVVVEDEES